MAELVASTYTRTRARSFDTVAVVGQRRGTRSRRGVRRRRRRVGQRARPARTTARSHPVARDDLDVLSPATGICLGRDDGINARRRRSESGADRFLAQRTGRMPELLVHVGDVGEFQESTDVIVVADVTGQDPFCEHCGGND
jgi:hypothetical protein